MEWFVRLSHPLCQNPKNKTLSQGEAVNGDDTRINNVVRYLETFPDMGSASTTADRGIQHVIQYFKDGIPLPDSADSLCTSQQRIYRRR
ncbi:hypothetical protein QJS10_CPB22g00207 [Acorus calamus]|uniref:Uncharacterized protein n=1 Tax=Acorus calamus TaxID=4465 RepID=A0AAV9C0L5_ACOCL|nr:hypothetical protein QJS10_CPB22g00207 [Acorus calamus]